MVKEVIFSGPEGRVEARFHKSEERDAPIAIVLHPHPLHGGTMNNKVVYNAFHTLVEMGFSVLRFNFRGVGKSDGAFDHGVGELIDAAASLDWLQLQCPGYSSCWIVGFSFGSWIALQLLMRRPEIAGFIAISPPANSYDFNFLSPCPSQGLIIQGTIDKIVKEEHAYELYEKLEKQRNSSVSYFAINGANHFFDNKKEELSEAIKSYVRPRIKVEQVVRKPRRDRRRRNIEAA